MGLKSRTDPVRGRVGGEWSPAMVKAEKRQVLRPRQEERSS